MTNLKAWLSKLFSKDQKINIKKLRNGTPVWMYVELGILREARWVGDELFLVVTFPRNVNHINPKFDIMTFDKKRLEKSHFSEWRIATTEEVKEAIGKTNYLYRELDKILELAR